jgi:3-dehydroquinate synthase class II
MKSLIRITAVAAVVAAALAFTGTSFAAEKAAKAKTQSFTGNIESAAADSVVVKKGDESKTFSVNAETKVATATNKEAAIADLKVGDKVLVGFVEADGKLVAKKIGPAVAGKKEKK